MPVKERSPDNFVLGWEFITNSQLISPKVGKTNVKCIGPGTYPVGYQPQFMLEHLPHLILIYDISMLQDLN